jgi:hypothetical protein
VAAGRAGRRARAWAVGPSRRPRNISLPTHEWMNMLRALLRSFTLCLLFFLEQAAAGEHGREGAVFTKTRKNWSVYRNRRSVVSVSHHFFFQIRSKFKKFEKIHKNRKSSINLFFHR